MANVTHRVFKRVQFEALAQRACIRWPKQLAMLERELYEEWFADIKPSSELSATELARFVATDIPTYSSGWEIYRIRGSVALTKHDRVIPEQTGQTRAIITGRERYIPSVCSIHVGGSFLSKEGFLHMFGRRPIEWPHSRSLVKIYINISPEGLLSIVHWARDVLDTKQLPFEFKGDVHPRRSGRTDSAILYVSTRDALRVCCLVLERFDGSPFIRERALPMTLQIGEGISLGPVLANSSYGSALCQYIAATAVDSNGNGNMMADSLWNRYIRHGWPGIVGTGTLELLPAYDCLYRIYDELQ